MSSRFSRRRPARATGRAGRGFTLVELMVAIAIIAVLVAIALPAFTAARRAAKRASTEAMISVLSTGLDQFHADSAFGGQYPPSAMQVVMSPHVLPAQEPVWIQAGGASFLAWGLAGADLLGTPGFRDLNGNKGSNDPNIATDVIGGCTDDTGTNLPNSPTGNPGGLYALNGTKPLVPRSGPYVEPSKVKTPKPKGNGFEIPVGNHALLSSICFLDAFDQPILYYRANPTATWMADMGSKVVGGNTQTYPGGSGSYVPGGVYNMLDNGGVLNDKRGAGSGNVGGNITGNDDVPGINLGGGTNHFNQNSGNLNSILGKPAASPMDLANNPLGSFIHQIGNPGVTAVPTAQNANSYILLSAGADGVFGTLDDVANFPVGK